MQSKKDEKTDKYYELKEIYSSLDETNQKLLWDILSFLKEAQEKRNKERD